MFELDTGHMLECLVPPPPIMEVLDAFEHGGAGRMMSTYKV